MIEHLLFIAETALGVFLGSLGVLVIAGIAKRKVSGAMDRQLETFMRQAQGLVDQASKDLSPPEEPWK